MSSKKTKIEAIDGRNILIKSGMDFVAWAATSDGKARVDAFTTYANMRAARGTIMNAAKCEAGKIDAALKVKRLRLQADKAENIARGVTKEEAARVYNEAIDAAKEAAKLDKAVISDAAKEARDKVPHTTTWNYLKNQLTKCILASGHTVDGLAKCAGTYYKAFGINLSDEALSVVGAWLKGLDVRQSSDAEFANGEGTITEQRDAYIAKMIILLLVDTLEKMQIIVPERYIATYAGGAFILAKASEASEASEG